MISFGESETRLAWAIIVPLESSQNHDTEQISVCSIPW